MDNQQGVGNAQPTEWIWLAGMMNGDGCFSLQLRKRENRWKCDVSITLTQTDPVIIERAVEILTSMAGCNPYIVEYPPTGAGVSVKYNMRINKMSHISRFLDNIIPHMCGIKQAKAKLMRRYVNNRLKQQGILSRRQNKISDDTESLIIARDFYTLNNKIVPKEISNALRDYPQGVGPSGPKRTAPKGEDIVQSCMKVQAAERLVLA